VGVASVAIVLLPGTLIAQPKVDEHKIVKNIHSQITWKYETPVFVPPSPYVAKLKEPPRPVVKTPYRAPTQVSGVSNPKLFIYNKESGNNPKRYNSQGCVGLGQACPGSKLIRACPNLDYACEDAWFTNYAVKRYGSWQGAYNFWVQNHWW